LVGWLVADSQGRCFFLHYPEGSGCCCSLGGGNASAASFSPPQAVENTLISRVQGALKQVPGLNSFCPPIQIEKFNTIFKELKILPVKHTRMFMADSE